MSLHGTVVNWPLWIGLVLYTGSAVLLIAAFSGGELSVLDPLQSASFIWTLLAAWLLLAEHVSLRNIAGVAIILAGIILLTSGRGRRKA
jgi:drug/metabolite transporter (DMT)-like permease